MTPTSESAGGDRLVALALIASSLFAIGWLGGLAWRERALIERLWYEASEQRYLTMAGEVGPVTYLVTHDDAAAFAREALALEGVLGVEPYDYPSVSAIAFADADEPAIARVNGLRGVLRMQRRFVPMICH